VAKRTSLKTEPISFRPSQGLERRLEALRQRSGWPKSALVESLTDEGERARRYPGLAFRGPDQRRRAWVIGSPYDVWEVIRAWQDLGQDSKRLAEELELNPRQVVLALGYYREFPEDIDEAIALARRPLSVVETSYPFIETLTLGK
jgi:hypothetical protein